MILSNQNAGLNIKPVFLNMRTFKRMWHPYEPYWRANGDRSSIHGAHWLCSKPPENKLPANKTYHEIPPHDNKWHPLTYNND